MKCSNPFMRWVHAGLVTGALLLLLISFLPGVEWAHIERERGVGPATYKLEASLEAYGFEYSLTARSSGGGVIIGGMGGLNRTIGPVRRTYPEVRGEVLENLGIIYDSYKVKSYIYELMMEAPPQGSGVDWPGPGSPSVRLNVTLRSDLVPYWPAIGTRTVTVTVELMGSDLHDLVGEELRSKLKVTVRKVIVKALTRYDPDTGTLSGAPVVLKESGRGMVLGTIGQRSSVSFDIAFPEGADVAGLYVDIEAGLNDYWDRPERSPLSGGANTINIRPVPAGSAAAILGIPLAFPGLILSMALGTASAVLSTVKKRPYLTVSIIGCVLAVSALLWFWAGVMSGVGLLSQRLEGAREGLDMSWGLFVAASGCLLLILSAAVQALWKFGARHEDEPKAPTFRRVGLT